MQELLKFFDLTPEDATMILVAIPLFVAFLKGAEKTLIRPFLNRINEREELTVGAGSSAESIIQEAVALEESYNEKINKARVDAVQARNVKVSAAKDKAGELLQAAEADVASRVTAERQKVRQQLETQRETLLKDVDSLAREIVQKLSQPRALSAFIITFVAAVVLNLVLVGDVFAAEGVVEHAAAHGAEHGAHHGYGFLFWYWINFALYIVAMYFILRKIVANGWDARRERIRFALEAGKRSMDAALERRAAAQKQSTQLESQVKELISTIEREGDLECQKLTRDAEQRAKDIQSHATESLGMEAKAQKVQMQREVAEIVLARASEMLRTQVTKESDRPLRQGAVAGVKNLVQ